MPHYIIKQKMEEEEKKTRDSPDSYNKKIINKLVDVIVHTSLKTKTRTIQNHTIDDRDVTYNCCNSECNNKTKCYDCFKRVFRCKQTNKEPKDEIDKIADVARIAEESKCCVIL